jgi:hypothetical protein
MAATLFDVCQAVDPDFARSEAICLDLEAMLQPLNDHCAVVITALATLLTAYLLDCPATHRIAMTDSVLDDIRAKILDAEADHAA